MKNILFLLCALFILGCATEKIIHSDLQVVVTKTDKNKEIVTFVLPNVEFKRKFLKVGKETWQPLHPIKELSVYTNIDSLIWRIVPKNDSSRNDLYIRYGQVPPGFNQAYPNTAPVDLDLKSHNYVQIKQWDKDSVLKRDIK